MTGILKVGLTLALIVSADAASSVTMILGLTIYFPTGGVHFVEAVLAFAFVQEVAARRMRIPTWVFLVAVVHVTDFFESLSTETRFAPGDFGAIFAHPGTLDIHCACAFFSPTQIAQSTWYKATLTSTTVGGATVVSEAFLVVVMVTEVR